jgi:hypothetical protein
MRRISPVRLPACVLLSAAAAFLGPLVTNAEEFEAVSGRVSSDYIRTKLPDGRFKPETYAFGKGGYWSGPLRDKTIDRMEFMDVAKVIAPPLAD